MPTGEFLVQEGATDLAKKLALRGELADSKLKGHIAFRFVRLHGSGGVIARAELVSSDGDPLFCWGSEVLQPGQSLICEGLEFAVKMDVLDA